MKSKNPLYGFVSIVMLMSLTIALTGCPSAGGGGGGGGGGGAVPSISFADDDTIGGSAFSASAFDLSPSESIQPLYDFYDNLGTKVGSYTPTKFELFIQEIVLYNATEAVELDVSLSEASLTDPTPHMADFINDVVIEPDETVPPGDYTGMFFFFFTSNADLGVGGTPDSPAGYVTVAPTIEVTLPPAYENVNAGVFETTSGGSGRNAIEDLGGGKFHFVPQVLQPDQYPDLVGNSGDEISRIELFAYIKDSPYRAILPGIPDHPDTWDTGDSDTLGLPNYGSTGDASAIVMPFNGVTIPEGNSRVRFTVAWDLDGIVEVWDPDGDTLGDLSTATQDQLSDDIVVLAEDFWERFSLIPQVTQ